MAWLSTPSPLFPLSTHTHWFLIQGSVTRPSQVTPVIKGGSPMWKVHMCSKLPWLFALTNFRPQENCCGKIVREWNLLLEPITMNGICLYMGSIIYWICLYLYMLTYCIYWFWHISLWGQEMQFKVLCIAWERVTDKNSIFCQWTSALVLKLVLNSCSSMNKPSHMQCTCADLTRSTQLFM